MKVEFINCDDIFPRARLYIEKAMSSLLEQMDWIGLENVGIQSYEIHVDLTTDNVLFKPKAEIKR